jgi:hypothetical protein|tara:strand:- start:333 stop:491 length:159 start_codon:yes stop_codon:yes gene_type:complete
MKLIKPITLEIEEEVWFKFKAIVPRTIKLNDAVTNLIRDFVSKKQNNKGDEK